MRVLVRFLAVVIVAASGLALGLALLAPQARGVLLAHSDNGGPVPAFRPLAQRSLVYASDGSVLAVLHGDQNRSPVQLKGVAPILTDAIVSVEDARFWDHNGIDVRGTLRALYADVQAGGAAQGGSTITQQLVKNALVGSKREGGRKLKEAALAVRLEGQLTKRQILERYVNTVYFGNGAYGVQAAAERYFGVGADRVTAGQAALLAGIIRNPLGYDPFLHPAAARARRDLALRRMVQARHLTSEAARWLSAEPLPPPHAELLPRPDGGVGYFVEQVKQQLLRDKRLGETASERYQAVFEGGLQIHTTLDPAAEQLAHDAVDRGLPDTKGRFTAALVTVDPQTGAVRALVGGPGFEEAKYNLATQGRRQAGSSFKVFTLVAALEAGHSPKDTISGSSPCTIPNPGGDPDPWRPGNYEGSSGRTLSLLDATAHSVNCAYARLAMIVGIPAVAETAVRMGITTRLDPTPAMTLGGLRNGVSPLEMASAYATLAADGIRHRPYFIERVADRDGHTILHAGHDGERMVSTQIARMTTDILKAVVKKGTGVKAAVKGHTVAGKTGTAQDYNDAWFVGYTPDMATAVWMGSPVGEVAMKSVGGISVTGGSYPARIWSDYVTRLLGDAPDTVFPAPDPRLVPRSHYLRLKTERSSRSRRSPTGSSGSSTRRRTHPSSTVPYPTAVTQP